MELADIQARNERSNDNLTLQQVEDAISSGQVLEQYPDTGRGESCLIVGFSSQVPIHIVCGWNGPEKAEVVLITVYKPGPPKFEDPWTRKKT